MFFFLVSLSRVYFSRLPEKQRYHPPAHDSPLTDLNHKRVTQMIHQINQFLGYLFAYKVLSVNCSHWPRSSVRERLAIRGESVSEYTTCDEILLYLFVLEMPFRIDRERDGFMYFLYSRPCIRFFAASVLFCGTHARGVRLQCLTISLNLSLQDSAR